jgi:quercetin dioxygenase-like cupin family protein
MIKLDKVSSLEEALDKNMDKDVDHVLIRHSYRKGTLIQPHAHNDSYEFVIVSNGHLKISSEGEEQELILDGERVVVIHYPPRIEHALEVVSEKLDYFVLRKYISPLEQED